MDDDVGGDSINGGDDIKPWGYRWNDMHMEHLDKDNEYEGGVL